MIFEPPVEGQRFLVPEVVQTSAMDCGPAALKSILEGFGIPVNYGRLREACQTDVDGTSINTLEDIAVQLGLQAEQVMLPADHLLLSEAQALPAIVVTRLPNGLTHFLVVWGRVGKFLQVMDPSTGRRWPSWDKFLNELYVHTFPVPVEAWRAWAGSDGLLAPLRRRMLDLEISEQSIDRLEKDALNDSTWRSLATLDAATRMTDAIVRSGGLATGDVAAGILERFYFLNLGGSVPISKTDYLQDADIQMHKNGMQIPEVYWSVTPMIESEDGDRPGEQPERLLLKGAVLVRVVGTREEVDLTLDEEQRPEEEFVQLPQDLQAALAEPTVRPEQEIWKALEEDGLLDPVILVLAIALATFAVLIEALLFQGLIQIGQTMTLVGQRILTIGVVMAFVLAPFLLELPVTSMVLRMGRRLETRLRIAFLEKIPRLGDRYFHSRLTSDMTQRAHDLRQLRMLPNLGVSLMRTLFQLILTAVGVIWLDPISAPYAIFGTIFFVTLSFVSQPLLEERDLRLRTHIGGLSRFYLDSLLGLVPARTHGAERAMRRQHETQMHGWIRTGREYYQWASLIQSVGTLFYSIFAVLIVVTYVKKGGQANEILLLFYWTLNLPMLGQALAGLIQQYPMQRNRILRLLEPLSAPDEEDAWVTVNPDNKDGEEQIYPTGKPIDLRMENVTVQAGGHEILTRINLTIQPGEHMAIVGLSGAGKSSLVGLLLGWHRPSQGRVIVDGQVLEGPKLKELRRDIAWVDPAVQIWNRSLYDNLRYGLESSGGMPIGTAIQKADLYDVLERLPDGMKTVLGEGGGLVSGGEGQRVRLGRAMLRPDARLVLLDEPFRGLDREKRRFLLAEARNHWSEVTLVCITHDLGETRAFPRVLVIENGQIIEDGSPDELATTPGSRYKELLEAEDNVRRGLWESADWRKLVMGADGRLEGGSVGDGVL